MRLAIVTTHPIQYNAPWFQLLAEVPGVDLHVFYTWEQSKDNAKYDPGFGRVVSWDIPLLEGYDYTFVKNIASDPGSHHFKGIDNPGLIQDIGSWKPDALLVIGWPFKSHLACLRHFKGKIPVLFRGDSTLLDEQPGFRKILRRLFLRYVYSHIDYALYVGTNNKAYFLAHGVKESQLWYVPHAIDNERFSHNIESNKKEAKEWRRKLGITDDQFVVLYAGKLEDVKNPQYILQLAAEITDGEFRFVIVGNGPLENELKKKASIDNRIIFVDFQNQQMMPVVYHLGNVVIMPSKSETWGLALNEAMACGKAVIATDKCGGAIDLVGGNGLIISTDDVEKAAGYITKLATDNQLAARAGYESIERISIFSFDAIKDAIAGLIRKIHGV